MMTATSFHALADSADSSTIVTLDPNDQRQQRPALTYAFSLHQHPYATELMRRLLTGSIAGLQAADTEPTPPGGVPVYDAAFFDAYQPEPIVSQRPVKELDFGDSGAYATYNWEL